MRDHYDANQVEPPSVDVGRVVARSLHYRR
jgi:hypothetical protein